MVIRLIFDDVLNLTWLQDANFPKKDLSTPGRVDEIIRSIGVIDGHVLRPSDFEISTGKMTWWGSMAWAMNLRYYDTERHLTLTGWQLPTVSPVGVGGFNVNALTFSGSTDRGYGITSPMSQMSYQFYVNLGNLGYCSSDGRCPRAGGGGGLTNSGPFRNVQSWYYHSGTSGGWPSAGVSEELGDFQFFFYAGDQSVSYKSILEYAWAVRPGDIAAVPEPESYAMLLTGLGILGAVARRRAH